jgi:hypothetical protein
MLSESGFESKQGEESKTNCKSSSQKEKEKKRKHFERISIAYIMDELWFSQ